MWLQYCAVLFCTWHPACMDWYIVHTHAHTQPRILSRALWLVILATARGCYVSLEQPGGSCVKHFPDFIRVRNRINKIIQGDLWKEQFMYGAEQLSLTYLSLVGSPEVIISRWMGTWGASTAKPTRLFGTASPTQLPCDDFLGSQARFDPSTVALA